MTCYTNDVAICAVVNKYAWLSNAVGREVYFLYIINKMTHRDLPQLEAEQYQFMFMIIVPK